MTKTMAVDHSTEAQIASETGHSIECFEWWMETALESGVDAVEIYALWYQEVDNEFATRRYGRCHCDKPTE